MKARKKIYQKNRHPPALDPVRKRLPQQRRERETERDLSDDLAT